MDSNNLAINHHTNTLDSILHPIGSSGLNMLQINIRGINRHEKLDSLCIFLQSLPVVIDVVVMGETWIKDSRCKYYSIPGFKSIFSSRSTSSHRGCYTTGSRHASRNLSSPWFRHQQLSDYSGKHHIIFGSKYSLLSSWRHEPCSKRCGIAWCPKVLTTSGVL